MKAFQFLRDDQMGSLPKALLLLNWDRQAVKTYLSNCRDFGQKWKTFC
jgi:hypothetical protein